MASPFGVSFVPGQPSPQGVAGGAGQRSPDRGVQEAVQILNLRLPKVYGSRSIAPSPLLTAPGGMGQPAAHGNVVAQALAQMAGLTPRQAPVVPMVSGPTPPSNAGGYTGGDQGSSSNGGNTQGTSLPTPPSPWMPRISPLPTASPTLSTPAPEPWRAPLPEIREQAQTPQQQPPYQWPTDYQYVGDYTNFWGS